MRSVVAGASDWERLAVGRVERIGRGEAGVEFVPSVRGAMRVAIGGEAGSRELLVMGGRGEVVKGASEVQGLSRVSRAEDGAVLSSTSRSQGWKERRVRRRQERFELREGAAPVFVASAPPVSVEMASAEELLPLEKEHVEEGVHQGPGACAACYKRRESHPSWSSTLLS